MKNSIIHKLNPTFKIIFIIIMMITTIIAKDYIDLLVISTYILILLLLSKIRLKIYLTNIKIFKILLLFILVINIILKNDLLDTIYLIIKIIYIILISAILTYTTQPTEITYGLEQLLKPFKKILKVKEIALIITLALSFIPGLLNQAEKIIKIQSSRGIDFYHSNIKTKLKSISYLFIPMFALSFKKADDIADIMSVRLYNYYDTRTNYQMNKFSYKDLVILIFSVIILAIIIIY